MISYGSPLYLSSFIRKLIGTYQGIILAWFATNAMIGNFSATLNFIALMLILINPVSTALFPAFSKLVPSGYEVRRMFRYSVKYTSLLIIPASIYVILMSKDVVSSIYGVKYNLASLYLSIYCILYLYAGLGSVVWRSFFNGVGETKIVFKGNVIYSIVYLPLAYLLTLYYGVIGLITTILVTILVSTFSLIIYYMWIATKRFNISIDLWSSCKIYISSILSLLPLVILVYYSSYPAIINLILSLIIYVIVYVTITPLMGCINKTDTENFKAIFGKIRCLNPIIKFIVKYESMLLRN